MKVIVHEDVILFYYRYSLKSASEFSSHFEAF